MKRKITRLFFFVENLFRWKMSRIDADFVMSVGPACRSAEALRRNKLRTQSSPFDWMMCYSLSTLTNFFKNDFKDFFEDVVDMKCDKNGKRLIKDSRTGMVSMHDFPSDQEVEAYYPVFIEKMNRRFLNVKRKIENARNVVFVAYREDEKGEIVQFLNDMDSLFVGKKLFFVNIVNRVKESIRRYEIKENLVLIEISFSDVSDKDADNWKGNLRKWDYWLSLIKKR